MVVVWGGGGGGGRVSGWGHGFISIGHTVVAYLRYISKSRSYGGQGTVVDNYVIWNMVAYNDATHLFLNL